MVMGVSMKPGATAFTVMLREQFPLAIAFVRPMRPAWPPRNSLAALPHCATTEATLIDARRARRNMIQGLLEYTNKLPVKLVTYHRVPIVRLHAHGEPSRVMAALLTKISSPQIFR